MISLQAYQLDTTLAVRVRGGEAPQIPTYGKDLHIAFVIDVSGSMEGERLESVKRTLYAARDVFTAGDHVTLVVFGNDARVITSNHPMDADGKRDFYRMVDGITISGSTNLSAGLEAVAGLHYTYDAIVVLTDGVVNRGITTNTGLRSLALGVSRGSPLHLLGYGSDHNRILLRDLALCSRGSYTYVDHEDTLPVAMGDLISGLRSEVARGGTITVTGGGSWVCQELGIPEGEPQNRYRIGGIVAERDYWVIFRAETQSTSATEIVFTADDQPFLRETSVTPCSAMADLPGAILCEEVLLEDTTEVREQIFRSRIAAILAEASDVIEGSGRIARSEVEDAVRGLKTEILQASEELRNRPLILRLVAQMDEVLELLAATPSLGFGFTMGHRYTDAMARLSSGTACISNQRGVLSQMPPSSWDLDVTGLSNSQGTDADDPVNLRSPVQRSDAFFSSPCQRTVSNHVRQDYYSTT